MEVDGRFSFFIILFLPSFLPSFLGGRGGIQKGKLRLKLKEKKKNQQTNHHNCGKNSRAKIFNLGIAVMMPYGNSSVAFKFIYFSFIQNPFFGYFFQNCCGFIHGIETWCIMRHVMHHRGRPIMNRDVMQTLPGRTVATHSNRNILAHSFLFLSQPY